MNIELTLILTGLSAAVYCAVAVSPAQPENKGGLNARQEAIVPISAFAASGYLEKRKSK